MNNNGTMNNAGTLDNQVGGTLNSTGSLTNDGSVFVTGGTVDATTIDNNGIFNFTGGTLSVDTFNGDLDNTGGFLSPGNSPGTTTITSWVTILRMSFQHC